MKTNKLFLFTAAATLTLFTGGCVCCSKTETRTKPASAASAKPLTEEEMNQKWMAAATPGAPHKALDVFTGEWNVASKWWMSPDAPPMESKGTASKKWILGGRYISEDFNGEMMGMPFTGSGLSGYDNVKKKYNSSWVDSSSTALFTSLGTSSADGKTFTYHSTMDDCMTGEMDKPVRFVIRVESHDKHIFEMFEGSGAKEKKVGEMTYTRR
jgi:hypothetical protein